MGVSDAYQRFIMVDIGASGRQSDGGVYENSQMGKLIKSKNMNFPPDEKLANYDEPMPYVLLGDEAFALHHHLMRPYPRSKNLNLMKRVFNYRLSTILFYKCFYNFKFTYLSIYLKG